jgi:acyl-CoA thioester hydrolase
VIHNPKYTVNRSRGRYPAEHHKAGRDVNSDALSGLAAERYSGATMGFSEDRMSNGSSGVVTYRGAVYPRDCDHIGHMNVAAYGAKFDEANWVLFCEIGLKPSYLRGERHGMAGVQQNISYSKELFAGDVIEIRSQVMEVADKRLRFRHEMRNIETGAVVAASEIIAVHLDKVAHKSCPFPAEVSRAATLLADKR